MYDTIKTIIGHTWQTSTPSSSEQQYIYYCCMVLIVIFSCVFIDMIYRVLRHFWHS